MEPHSLSQPTDARIACGAKTMRLCTRESLHQLVVEHMNGARFIAVSNREPCIHQYNGGQIECMTPASGLVTALNPIMRASGGVWVAHGSGTADRASADDHGRVGIPAEAPAYTLRRVWLPADIERGYYYGLANEGLWPLCHLAFRRPRFSRDDWESYRRANELFAEAVLEEANGGPAFVFIQDYHFALLPEMLRRANPRLAIAQFWHIPWPPPDTFRIFPWGRELLEGLLGNDLLGFQLSSDCANFLGAVEQPSLALTDDVCRQVHRCGHSTNVRPFPISIDFEEY